MPPKPDQFTRRTLLARGAGLVVAAPAARALLETRVAGAAGAGAVQAFVSRPDLRPPAISVLHSAAGATPGYVFVAPSSGPGQRGAMIFDDAGQLVWFRPVRHKAVTDFKAGVLHGRPVLTWWEGKSVDGLGDGQWVVVDSSYRELARLAGARGLHADLHDFVLTPHGTALGLSNEVRTWDLRSVGGSSRGHVVGGVVQELAVPSGRLLWEWRSLDHVAVAETEVKSAPGSRFDYFHINSVDVAPDGDIVVSARNTWAAYKVDKRTGLIVWRLGGKRSDFAIGPGAHFEWQHDVREHPGGVISVFDNAAAPQEEPQSRALLLSLDTRRKRVSLLRGFAHRPERVLSHFLGNTQLLAGGGVFVGWGGSPYMTEFAHDGAVAFDARLPPGGESYRAFRFSWVGRPSDRPTLAVRDGVAYASWNGATEVASWQVLEAEGAGEPRPTHVVPRTGFETSITPAARTRSVAVVALDATGAHLGSAPTVSI